MRPPTTPKIAQRLAAGNEFPLAASRSAPMILRLKKSLVEANLKLTCPPMAQSYKQFVDQALDLAKSGHLQRNLEKPADELGCYSFTRRPRLLRRKGG
jgi:hypothetical protein